MSEKAITKRQPKPLLRDTTVRVTGERLRKALDKLKLSPEEEIAKIAQDPGNDVEIRLKALTWLGNKLVPDLKSIDIQADVKSNLQIVVKNFGTKHAAELAKPIVRATLNI